MIDDHSVASDEVLIAAPIHLVWSILVDFDNYQTWNDFCPQVKAELKLGSPVDMMIDLGQGLQQQVEYITLIDAPNAIAWSMENKPDDPVHACRTQRLTAVDEHSCRYVTIDEFSGVGMPAMLAALGAGVEAGFNRCAYGLKAHAEAMYAAQKD